MPPFAKQPPSSKPHRMPATPSGMARKAPPVFGGSKPAASSPSHSAAPTHTPSFGSSPRPAENRPAAARPEQSAHKAPPHTAMPHAAPRPEQSAHKAPPHTAMPPHAAPRPQSHHTPAKPVARHARPVPPPPPKHLHTPSRPPVRYKSHKHTFIFYPVPIYDERAGIYYDSGYYDENGEYYAAIDNDLFFCENCGTEIIPGATVCANCGSSLLMQEAYYKSVDIEYTPVVPRKKSKAWIWIVAIAILVILYLMNR